MYLPRYTYEINESFLDYEFTSIGPKGAIKKIVRFTEIDAHIFNLGFGDLDIETGEINDLNVTNNNDSRKILATVAAAIHDFTLQYPGVWIFAKGSSLSRTRLYRMGITNHWDQIDSDFELFGLTEIEWERFEKRREYDAFLIRRKKL
jgi:hypothetical protein